MLDALDKAILNILGQNCRTSYQTIAEKQGISATAVKKRVEKLVETGVLSQFTVEYNLAMIDAEFFMALVDTDGSVPERQLIDIFGENRMIAEAGALTGGQYILFGSYIGSLGLKEISDFLRNQDSVRNVELHTLLFIQGRKERLKRLHLRVLRLLLTDPRMPITKIAKECGLAARTVSRAIDEILDSETVRLSIRWNLNASDAITFLLKLVWDEKKRSFDDVYSWLRKRFPQEFWEPLISAGESVMFPAFVVESLRDVERITNVISQEPFIKSTTTLLGKPSRSFKDLRRYRLEEDIRAAGFL
jgi:DNA-binding Lrp family transcriptional regulator